MTPPAGAGRRIGDRVLWIVVGVAALMLAAALGFAFWVNARAPMQPVPVASSPRA